MSKFEIGKVSFCDKRILKSAVWCLVVLVWVIGMSSLVRAGDAPTAATLSGLSYASASDGPLSVRLSWSPSTEGDIQHYKIYRATSPGVTEQDTLVATINSDNPDGLHYSDSASPTVPPGTTYYYRVFVVDNNSQSTGSNEQSILLVVNSPTAVTLDAPTYGGDPMMGWMGVQLSWSASTETNIQNYKIYRATSPGVTEGSTLVATIDPDNADGMHYSDDNVTLTTAPGTTYYYRIFVVDNAGQSTGSNETSITLIDNDDSLTVVTLSTLSYTSAPMIPEEPMGVQLNWLASTETSIKSYKIYRSTTPGVTEKSTLVATINPDKPDGMHYSDNNVTPTAAPGTTYFYRVFVVDDANQSTDSNEQSITLATNKDLPAAVTLDTLTFRGDLTLGQLGVQLNWSASTETDIQKYQIYRATHLAVSQADTLIAEVTPSDPWDTYGGDDARYTDTTAAPTVPPGTTYYYRVFVVDNAGQSTGSNEQSITLTKANPPDAPGIPQASRISATSLALEAPGPDLPAFATSITLQMRMTDATWTDIPGGTNLQPHTTVSVTGLKADRDYSFRAVAVGVGGSTTGLFVDAHTASVSSSPPQAVTVDQPTYGKTPGSAGSSGIIISFDTGDAAGVDSYSIYRSTSSFVSDADMLVITLAPKDIRNGHIIYNDLTAQTKGINTSYYYRVYVNGSNGQKAASNIASIISLAGGGWKPPAIGAHIKKIKYSVDQGKTWVDYPTTPGAYITAEQSMAFGLRAIKDNAALDYPFATPAWVKQGENDEMYGDTVWVMYDTPSTDNSDLRTVTVTCYRSIQIKVKVNPE